MVFGDMDFYKKDKEAVNSNNSMNLGNIYDEYISLVYRIVLYYCKDKNAAEDIAQDVFEKLCVNVDNVKSDAIKTWLVTTAKNMSRNYKRDSWYEIADDTVFDEKNRRWISEDLENEFIQNLKGHEYRGLTNKIFEELYKKNVRWHDEMLYTYILERPKSEVAERMQISIELLYTDLSRARRWIENRYKEEYDRLKNT